MDYVAQGSGNVQKTIFNNDEKEDKQMKKKNCSLSGCQKLSVECTFKICFENSSLKTLRFLIKSLTSFLNSKI